MNNPETLTTVLPLIQVLAQTLERSSLQYQQLQSRSIPPLYQEAGTTLRHITQCYSQVLCAVLDYYPDLDVEEEDEDAMESE